MAKLPRLYWFCWDICTLGRKVWAGNSGERVCACGEGEEFELVEQIPGPQEALWKDIHLIIQKTPEYPILELLHPRTSGCCAKTLPGPWADPTWLQQHGRRRKKCLCKGALWAKNHRHLLGFSKQLTALAHFGALGNLISRNRHENNEVFKQPHPAVVALLVG